MTQPFVSHTDEPPYVEAVEQLVADEVASRIARRDPTLWGSGSEDEAARRLGWVDVVERSADLPDQVAALRAELAGEGVDSVVLCGMGGSSLAPEVITGTADKPLTVLDSTDPQVVRRAVTGDLARTVVVVSSKSGGTVETDSQRRAFVAAFDRAGIDPANRLVVVTDPKSPLHRLALDEKYRRVFLADPDVGGRYSALTAFGLVPAGLAGADVARLLEEADSTRAALAADRPDNPAVALGAALGGSRPLRDKVVLVDDGSGLVGFGGWAEQLLAESTGKDGTGLLPVVVPAPGPTFPAADQVVVHLAAPGTASVPAESASATVTGSLGAQFLLWETAVAVAGRLLDINPFDQPDVESAKQATRELLEGGASAPDPPAFVDGAVEVRASAGLLDGVSDLSSAVAALLDRLDPDRGYLAVMAYLDRQADSALTDVGGPLADRAHRPVTIGWGPRFLHSTGQYHKGGPETGVYLQVTGAPGEDLDIPGRDFTFGELIGAQAAGDARVLSHRGRPVLRLHLTDRGKGVDQLLSVLR